MRDALGGVQRVLVLGGTSEIGLAIVDELARHGRLQELVLACRHPEAAAGTVEEWRARGVATRAVTFDARATEGHRATIADAAAHGDIDVVVAAVGVLGDERQWWDDPSSVAELLGVNTAGTAAALLTTAEQLRRQGHGTIVVLSSVAGVRARADNFVYGASKAGLDTFAQGLADALDGSGVDVVIVRPGFVDTRMTEGMVAAPFATDAPTVARLTVEGIVAGRRVVWAPPVLRWVFLALRILPRPVWRAISSTRGGARA